MTTLAVRVAGIGAWCPGYAGWRQLRDALVDPSRAPEAVAAARPVAALLPPAERRRTPDGVAVALAVADEAMRAGADALDGSPAAVASVFASAHGELAIVDYLCETLASDPTLLSPTRFHHSVHNAAAGYWSIATGNQAPTTAIAAGEHSFATGLTEAVVQVVAEARPVLFVVFDTPAVGLLAAAVANRALFGAAWLLVPERSTARGRRLTIAVDDRGCTAPAPRAAGFAELASSSPAARSLPLLEALAWDAPTTLAYPTGPAASISVSVLREHDA